MKNHPIPVAEANIMIGEYLRYLKDNGIDPASQTQSVLFTGLELMDWLRNNMSNADELKICLGVYPPGHIDAGRITTILWPYKGGQPATMTVLAEGKDDPPPPPPTDPYNAGTLNP